MKELNVYQLAKLADCADPESKDSAGGKFLLDVQAMTHEAIELDEVSEDTAHEIADNAPDIYTHQMWLQFVDLSAYQEDVSEFGPMTLDRSAGVALYLIAYRLATAILGDYAV